MHGGIPVMGEERRNYDRQPISSALISGSFLLTCRGQDILFDEVEDISVSGLGVVIPTRLENGVAVEIAYRINDRQVTACGHVAWVVAGEQGFHTGIHFDPVNMNENVNFFMCMREFVNEQLAGF